MYELPCRQENLCFWVNLGQCTSSQSPSSSTAFVLAQISIVPPKVLFVFLLPWTHVCLSSSVPPPFDLPLESSSVRLHGDFLLGERNKDGLDTDELDCMYDLSMDRHFVWYYCKRLRMKNQSSSTHTWASKSPILSFGWLGCWFPPSFPVHVWFYL